MGIRGRGNRGIGITFSTAVMVVLIAVLCFLSVLTNVGADTPTREQLELLRQLPAAQQEKLLTSFGASAPARKVEPLSTPVIVKPIAIAKATATAMAMATLVPFGYDLFAGSPTTFSPVTEIPVPVNYIIGPGDTIQVQLFGKENAEYELIVNRNGQLQFPGVGPIAVTGMRFVELKEDLARRIHKKMLGVKAYVSLGALRSMRVFVMGDVNRPGSYMVSSLSTMTNALFVSGGVKTIGSLRDIQLKRSGKTVQHFDLYGLLLKGDTSKDARIQPGDVIFVPPVGETVGITGEVRRPAIYEIRKKQTVQQLIEMAGGLLPTAYSPASQLQRISPQGERTLVNVDLSLVAENTRGVRNGDTLRIFPVPEKMEDVVYISGHVQRPGGLQWFKGMRLSDVIPNIKHLLPEPGLRFVLVRRERQPDRMIEMLASRMDNIFSNPDSASNLTLLPQDQVFLFGLTEKAVAARSVVLSRLVQEMRQQVSQGQVESVVSIEGNVQWPGEYPLPTQFMLPDLLRAAGDVKPNSDLHYVLVVRENAEGTSISTQSFDFTHQSGIERAQTYALSPRDKVYVFDEQQNRPELLAETLIKLKQQASLHAPASVISVSGFVRSSGEYPLEPGMTVTDLIRAAGGLIESAYSLEAEISRYDSDDNQTRNTQHLAVKLGVIFAGDISEDRLLKAHDSLHIKRRPHWTDQRVVELKGEVRFPGSYPVSRDETLLEVIKRAGGLTDQAFPAGAILVREGLRKKEQQQLDTLQLRLESDLAAVDLEKTQAGDEKQDSLGLVGSLLQQLRSTKAVGRLVINLPQMLKDDANSGHDFYTSDNGSDARATQDVLLRNGDKLFIPPVTQEVTILGEVQLTTSHLFTQGSTVSEYIDKSGGLTYRADEDRIYVVRANGEVSPSHAADWFSGNVYVKPGDTIVVPLDAERMKPLTLWTSVSQIIYQIGVAAASWNAVGIF